MSSHKMDRYGTRSRAELLHAFMGASKVYGHDHPVEYVELWADGQKAKVIAFDEKGNELGMREFPLNHTGEFGINACDVAKAGDETGELLRWIGGVDG